MKHFYYNDTYAQMLLSDKDVSMHWKPKKPIVDKDSTDIKIKENWNYRQKQYAVMRRRKVKLLENIYSTNHMGYRFIVSYKTGRVYYYKENVYRHVVKGDCIILIRIRDGETKLVYRNGQFYATKRVWLKTSIPQMSSMHYLGIVLRQRVEDSVFTFYLKDHHLIAVLFYGEKAIHAIGDEEKETGKFVINHRNLYIYDNRPENLEIVTEAQNKEHRMIMYKAYEEAIYRSYGADVDIYWLEDKLMGLDLAS